MTTEQPSEILSPHLTRFNVPVAIAASFHQPKSRKIAQLGRKSPS